LLQHRRRAEQALVSLVATSYLLGVASLSKSQVSQMAAHLDAQVEAFATGRSTAGRIRSCGSMR
jgi:transposase-like protein